MSLHDDELLLKRLKLKLAINRYLLKLGRDYASQVYRQLRAEDCTLFKSVLDEMASEGMLTKETGGQGALILVYRDMEDVCPNS